MRVLILGGTGEALALARACHDRGGLEPVTSLAGRTRAPTLPMGDVRCGGFGGVPGLLAYLTEHRIERVVDATHPFTAQIGRHAHDACARAAVPRLRLLRPAWPRVASDRWHEVADAAVAARLLPSLGGRAFLTLGQGDLAAFRDCPGVAFVVRTIEPVPTPAPLDATWLRARGPFAEAEEFALMRDHRIEVLVSKASGGAATYPKIGAARSLGLPVVMIRRPPPPPGPLVATVAEALAWLETGP